MMFLTAALALLAPALPADTTIRIEPGTTVEVSSFSQPITVTGTSGDRLVVRGASVDVSRRHVDIEGRMFGPGAGGPIVIQVPTSARLVIDVVSGMVTVTDAPDYVEIEAVDGRVSVSGGRGEMILSATGEIAVADFAGTRLTIEGLAGGISVRGASGTIEIDNVNGPILLDGVTSRRVHVTSVNGRIQYRGSFDPTGQYEFDSHNGGVELELADAVNARLRIETFNGGFSSEIPATVTGADRGKAGPTRERQITATYGRGQASVEITTFNAGVQVRRLGRK